MKRPSFTVIISGIFLAYIAHSLYTIYGLFNPVQCTGHTGTAPCYKPFLRSYPDWQLKIYTSLKRGRTHESHLTLIWNYNNISLHESESRDFNVSIPSNTKNNGSLYVHVVLLPRDKNDLNSNVRYSVTRITTHTVPQAVAFNLMGDKDKPVETPKPKDKAVKDRKPITHWRSKLAINIMTEDVSLPANLIPGDIGHYLHPFPGEKYFPPLFIDELSYRTRDLIPVNNTTTALPLTISYAPISFGKLRLWVNMLESMRLLQGLGFSEKDTDEVKGIFADTNLYFLLMTFLVSALHLLFDFLAFKNDVSYWKNRENMIGLSTRVVLWRCASTIIIFFYLLDEETSLLVLIPCGIGALIEIWKVKKALKISVVWTGWRPSLSFGSSSSQEKKTEEYDSQAMKYLSYLLYPLLAAGAVYSLIYTPHKSWYSWCLKSLVNGVYAFGFLFMLPQLFVNYKLKSVAHLPWRAFMYKAFNTFIDDIFAFIITMPMAHRLACFRDDLVFLVYLYQRWLYPVDKTRVNEFGQSFDSETSKKTKEEKKKQ